MISVEQWKKMAEIGSHRPNTAGYQSVLDAIDDEFTYKLSVIESQLDMIEIDENGDAQDPGDEQEYEDLLDKRDALSDAYREWEDFSYIDYVKFLDQLNRGVS